MEGVGQSHRPHPAQKRIAHRHHRDEQDSNRCVDPEEQLEQTRERHELSRYPAEVSGNHDAGGEDFGSRTEAPAEEIAQRQEAHLPERLSEEKTGEDQTETGSYRIESRGPETLSGNLLGDDEDGSGSEPGGEQSGPSKGKRKTPPGDDEILGATDAPANREGQAVHPSDIKNDNGAQEPGESGRAFDHVSNAVDFEKQIMITPRAHHDRIRPSASPNESFWLDTIDTDALQPPLEGDHEADVVLVGGGYTSLVTAYCLKQQQPDLEVVILESSYVGFGSSGRNAGMVLHDPHLDRLSSRGERSVRFTYDETVGVIDWIDQLAREEGFDCELERTGYLEIAFHPVHVRRIEELQVRARQVGIELPFLNGNEIRARLHSERFVGALLYPRAAVLHPGKYVAGLKAAVLKAGVRLYEQTWVTGITEGEEVRVTTETGSVRAPKVVVGLNAYLPASGLGAVPDKTVSLSSFIVLTEPLSDSVWSELGWVGREGYSDLRRMHNYVRLTGKRILFGGRVLYHFGVESPAKIERIYQGLRTEMVRTFPCLEDVGIAARWSGPVAITERRTPFIGRTGNIFYAMGYSGMGVSLGTLAGQVLADVVVGNEDRWRDLLYLNDRDWALPPEPFRYLGFQASYYTMRLGDWLDRFV